MLLRFDDLAIKFSGYSDIKGKIQREVRCGNLIPVARGLYETDAEAAGKYLAGSIYGPSYLSFEYMLSEYSLIPDGVYKTYTSATFHKGKTKIYENAFGYYTYRDVPDAVYSAGVLIVTENGYSYQIATAEKALCDKLYALPPVQNLRQFKALLFDDLRIDESIFLQLNFEDIRILAPLYRANNLKYLLKFTEGM